MLREDEGDRRLRWCLCCLVAYPPYKCSGRHDGGPDRISKETIVTPIELSTRRRVTGLTSDEFARLFVAVEKEVNGENAQWDADDVESWEIIGPPATADQHLRDALGSANEFVATLADQIYRAAMTVDEAVGITAYSDNLTFWAEHPGFGGMPYALWNFAALQAIEWIRKETGVICELETKQPLI